MYTNLEFKKHQSSVILRLAIVSALIFSIFSPLSNAASQPMLSSGKVQTEKKYFNVVILGDSLAVGYEHGFTEQSRPNGVGENIYEQALFQGYRAAYANYGVLGLRSEGLKLWLEAAAQKQEIKPAAVQAGLKDPRVDTIIGNTAQLYQDIEQADLIILAIGGNDFLQILSQLDLTKSWNSWTATEQQNLLNQLEATTEHYIEQLSSILSILNELNRDAVIATQNQYLPLPKITFNGKESYVGVDPGLARQLENARTSINSKFDAVIKEFTSKGLTIDYIDAASTIESNALGLTAIGAMDVHPNAAGYKKLSEQYSKLLWGEWRVVQPRKADIPLSVVVNGKEVVSPYPTKLINGRTYLVLSDITGAMGAGLSWSNKTQTATITIDDRVVELTIGASTYKVNGQSFKLNAEPAFLTKVNNESKTYVPVAALSEGLGFFVEYLPLTKTVFVNR